LKPKPKRKRDHINWRLDFVTALTVDECRERLERATARLAPDWQRIYLGDDNSFIIERLVTRGVQGTDYEGAVEIRFKGTLEQVATGTRVRGTITEDTYERLMTAKWLVGVLAVIALTMLGIAAIVTGTWEILIVAVVVFGLFVAGVTWDWNRTKWYPVQLMNWIRQQLFVPPNPIE
jgi:hypothetical protein